MKKVSYRYHKNFTSTYIDNQGIESIRTYEMCVRDIDNNVLPYFEPLENIFLENGVMEKFNIDELVIRKVDLFKAYEVIEKDIKYNNAKSLHKIG
jgi:aminoglycoside 3-N-acetyltransferase